MVSPTQCTLHDLNRVNIWKVLFPGNNVSENMPMFGSWVCPNNLMSILLMKNSVANDKFKFSIELEKIMIITVHLALTIFPSASLVL